VKVASLVLVEPVFTLKFTFKMNLTAKRRGLLLHDRHPQVIITTEYLPPSARLGVIVSATQGAAVDGGREHHLNSGPRSQTHADHGRVCLLTIGSPSASQTTDRPGPCRLGWQSSNPDPTCDHCSV
jgi:hypothetical protein